MAINQTTLSSKSYSYNQRLDEAKYTASNTARRTAFLCHSHKDEALVKGLIVIFREAGVDLYVDWLDQTMPEKPNKVTAQKIQNRIKTANIFLFLATANSKASRWCPWEIGYADGVDKNIFIVPTSDGNNTYGNEYLDLYRRIDVASDRNTGKSGFGIFESSDTGVWLNDSTLR